MRQHRPAEVIGCSPVAWVVPVDAPDAVSLCWTPQEDRAYTARHPALRREIWFSAQDYLRTTGVTFAADSVHCGVLYCGGR